MSLPRRSTYFGVGSELGLGHIENQVGPGHDCEGDVHKPEDNTIARVDCGLGILPPAARFGTHGSAQTLGLIPLRGNSTNPKRVWRHADVEPFGFAAIHPQQFERSAPCLQLRF